MPEFGDGGERIALLRAAVRVSWFSVVWSIVVGLAALVSGLAAGSLALVGFGLDSVVDSSASVVLVWRFKVEGLRPHHAARVEQIAAPRGRQHADRHRAVHRRELGAFAGHREQSGDQRGRCRPRRDLGDRPARRRSLEGPTRRATEQPRAAWRRHADRRGSGARARHPARDGRRQHVRVVVVRRGCGDRHRRVPRERGRARTAPSR